MHSLKSQHTFALNAQCPNIETVDSTDSLIRLVSELNNSEYLIVGEGSNTVFTEDFSPMVVLNRIKGIDIKQDANYFYLRVGGGENWHNLVTTCMRQNIGGFENLALIPGTVGAAPIQNIGAYGVEIERFVESVEYLDTQTMLMKTLNKKDCQFAYRDSIFKRQDLNTRIITHVNFKLAKNYPLVCHYGPLQSLADSAKAKLGANDIFDAVIRIRKSKLPDVKELGNAGSFFKNPVISKTHFNELKSKYEELPHYYVDDKSVKIPAAWLIDFLGFKGKRNGDIASHQQQALVLVNLGNGTGQQLLSLAREIKQHVKIHFDIELENEVRLMGREGLLAL